MKVISPMATGSGAYVLHQQLAGKLPGYRMRPFSPWWALVPPMLPFLSSPKADIVHTGGEYGWLLRQSHVPLVVTVHNYVSDSFMRAYSGRVQYLHNRTLIKYLTRRTVSVADRVVVISRYMEHILRADLGTDVPMRLIYNGVDEDAFVPGEVSRNARGRPLRILFCGNLNRRKRPHLLVSLANELGKDFELHYTAGLAGSTLDSEGLKPSAARLVSVGKVSHADMPELYQRMDLLFMPSVREGFGLCVAEAMACGLPVVAADASASPELVDRAEGGRLVPVDDLQGFAAAIRELAESPELRRAMGEFNRSRVESRFRLADMVESYRLLFEELADLGGR